MRRLNNTKQMMKCGLYINDLALHDSTRAAVLAGSQQSNQLSAALQKVTQLIVGLENKTPWKKPHNVR